MVQSNAELNFFIVNLLFLIFIGLTFNEFIALVYGFFLLLGYILYDSARGSLRLTINKIKNNSLKSLVVGLAATGIFLGVSYASSFFLQAAAPILGTSSIGEFISTYARTFAEITPIFSDSKILTLIVFAGPIALLETWVIFGLLFDRFALISNTSLNSLRSGRLWALMFFISVMFTYFHFQVRGLGNNVGLLGTFLFAMISMIIIIRVREIEPALYFHSIWNAMIVFNNVY